MSDDLAAATPFAKRESFMTVDPNRILRLTRRFNASPERVFDAWLNPETAKKWLFATPADEMYTAELDARVGGRYTITARRAGTDYTGSASISKSTGRAAWSLPSLCRNSLRISTA